MLTPSSSVPSTVASKNRRINRGHSRIVVNLFNVSQTSVFSYLQVLKCVYWLYTKPGAPSDLWMGH